MAQELAQEELVESVQEESTTETSEKSKASKKVDLASRIPEYTSIGGYVTSKEAAKILSDYARKEIPQTTVNNLAYNGKIEAIKIAGIFLFKRDGEKSVTAYVPLLTVKNENSLKRQEEKSRKTQQKRATDAFKKHINDAIAKGQQPDIEALKKELGIS